MYLLCTPSFNYCAMWLSVFQHQLLTKHSHLFLSPYLKLLDWIPIISSDKHLNCNLCHKTNSFHVKNNFSFIYVTLSLQESFLSYQKSNGDFLWSTTLIISSWPSLTLNVLQSENSLFSCFFMEVLVFLIPSVALDFASYIFDGFYLFWNLF